MAVSFIQARGATSSSVNITFLSSASTLIGDLLIIGISTANQEPLSITDWTKITTTTNDGTAGAAGSLSCSAYYKFATVDGSGTSVTIPDVGSYIVGYISTFRGVNAASPIRAYNQATYSASTSVTLPSVTPTNTDDGYVGIVATDLDSVSTGFLTSWAGTNCATGNTTSGVATSTGVGGGIGWFFGVITDANVSTYASVTDSNNITHSAISLILNADADVENHTGAVSLTQASTVAALGTMGAKGAVSVSQASTVSAIGKKAVSGAVSVTQASSTTIAGTRSEATNDKTGSVSVTQAFEVAILGKVGLNGAVSVSQVSSVAISGKLGAKGTVSVAQGSTVSAQGTRGAKGSVSVDQASSVAISGTKFVQTYDYFGRLDVVQTSSSSINGKKSVGGSVNIYQISGVQTLGKKNGLGSLSISQASSVIVYRFKAIVKTISLTSTVNIGKTRTGQLNATKRLTSVYRNSKSLSSVLNDTYRKETKI